MSCFFLSPFFDFLPRLFLALEALAGAGAGVGAGAGAGVGAGAGEDLLLSSDMDRDGFRDGADTFFGGGLLYSNLMASLILALLEAVDASDMDLVF